MRVYTYSRFSTDRQTEASIVDQQRACREYAERKGWSVDRHFTDEAISGAALGNRPGVLGMLEAVQDGDVLLIADLTRLSRSQDLAPLLERMRFKGVKVLGVLDSFDSDAPHARMQAGVSGLMSDEQRAHIRVRTHLALETRAKTQRPTGGRAYGFDNAGQPVEPEATVVREVFAQYAAGEALLQIVSSLNQRGVPSPGATWNRAKRRQDARWLVSAVHEMLRNERYLGRVVWNRSKWVKDPETGIRQRRERPRSEWIVHEGPALVDEATWRAAQARNGERKHVYGGGRGGQPRYLLSGLLVCEGCDARLIITGSKGSHYYCGSHRQGGAAACAVAVGTRRDVAEELILKPLREELLSPESIEEAVLLIRQMHRQQRTTQVHEPSSELRQIDADIEALHSLIKEASASMATRLRVELDRAYRERETIRRKAWRRAAGMGEETEVPAEKIYREQVQRMGDRLNGANLIEARDVLRSLLGEIPVRPHESGRYLVAQVGINILPLLKAAGIDWVGSGGVIPNQSTRQIDLVRSA